VRAPFRVVVLTLGPGLASGVREFIGLLESHPDIELGAVAWQTQSPTFGGVVRDLWRRRGWLAGPLLVQKYLARLVNLLMRPVHAVRLSRTVRSLRDRIHCFEDIHAPEALEMIRACRPLLLLVYGAPIVRESLYTIAPLGTLGIHHGKVPEYRGKKTLFWAIYNGELTAGVTIQRINDALDGGDVIEAGEVRIGYRLPWMIWRELERLGMRLYLKAILNVCNERATYSEQQEVAIKPYRDPAAKAILEFWLRYLHRLAAAALPGAKAGKPDGRERR
jgi:hypothetical protein